MKKYTVFNVYLLVYINSNTLFRELQAPRDATYNGAKNRGRDGTFEGQGIGEGARNQLISTVEDFRCELQGYPTDVETS